MSKCQCQHPEPAQDAEAEKLPLARDLAAERRVQIAAARLRVTLDQRLNRETPLSVVELAKEQL